jgi:hypothetical protein
MESEIGRAISLLSLISGGGGIARRLNRRIKNG